MIHGMATFFKKGKVDFFIHSEILKVESKDFQNKGRRQFPLIFQNKN